MTCFWQGIYTSLSDDDFKFIGEIKPNNLQDMILIFKRNFDLFDTDYIFYRGYEGKVEALQKQFMGECKKSILDYDMNNMHFGYYCSTCDPFLILVCMLFKVEIKHKYMGVGIKYIPRTIRKTVSFYSDSAHFQRTP